MTLFRFVSWFLSLVATEESISLPGPSPLVSALRVAPYSGIIYFDVRCPKCGGNARQHRRAWDDGTITWGCVPGGLHRG